MSPIDLYWYFEGLTTAFFACMLVVMMSRSSERIYRVLGYNLAVWLVMHLLPLVFPQEYISENFRVCAVINGYDMVALPVCVFLIAELCNPGYYTTRRLFVEEIPILAIQTAYIVLDKPFIYNILISYSVVYAIVYSRILYKWIGRYNAFLREHFSYTENLSLRWIYYVLAVLIVVMALWVCTLTFLSTYVDCIFLGITVLAWSMICWFVNKQESILGEIENASENLTGCDSAPTTPCSTSDETDAGQPLAATECAHANDISVLIREKFLAPQLYLNHKLTLSGMAQAIGTNRTYLSRYINEEMNMTFYEYVNGLRLEYASQLIDSGNDNLTQIAHDSGFNSYATFRRAYILRYGVAPSKHHPRNTD